MKSEILIEDIKIPEDNNTLVLILQSDGKVSVFSDRLLSLLRQTANTHGLRHKVTKATEVPPHDDLVSRGVVLENVMQCDFFAYGFEAITEAIGEVPAILKSNCED
ncbi:MAG: hypothetical protein IK091_05505 [Spirochaetales bacterium]|nr:hypothetical protein [Spirochaetales bacterium]